MTATAQRSPQDGASEFSADVSGYGQEHHDLTKPYVQREAPDLITPDISDEAQNTNRSAEHPTDPPGKRSANERVRDYRASRQRQDKGRLDVWVRNSLINDLRQLANDNGLPPWRLVEAFLDNYLQEFRDLKAESERLQAEQVLLQTHNKNPQSLPRFQQYNQEAALFRERLKRFPWPRKTDAESA